MACIVLQWCRSIIMYIPFLLIFPSFVPSIILSNYFFPFKLFLYKEYLFTIFYFLIPTLVAYLSLYSIFPFPLISVVFTRLLIFSPLKARMDDQILQGSLYFWSLLVRIIKILSWIRLANYGLHYSPLVPMSPSIYLPE